MGGWWRAVTSCGTPMFASTVTRWPWRIRAAAQLSTRLSILSWLTRSWLTACRRRLHLMTLLLSTLLSTLLLSTLRVSTRPLSTLRRSAEPRTAA